MELNMKSFKRDERRRNMEKSENKKFKTGRQISLTSTTHEGYKEDSTKKH
jgi:hypothetical protein